MSDLLQVGTTQFVPLLEDVDAECTSVPYHSSA